MTEATVAANLHQTLDVLGGLTTEVTLDGEVSIDVVAELDGLLLGEVADTGVRVHAGGSADLLCAGQTDAIDVSQTNFHALLARKVDTKNTSQCRSLPLTLTLLVAGVLADHVNLAMASDDLALIAHSLDRRTYLHNSHTFR